MSRSRQVPRPRPERSLGITVTIDVHLLDDESDAMAQLRTLHRDGWIRIMRASVMELETSRARDPAKRLHLQELQTEFIEQIGVGDSRLGLDPLVGSEDDERRRDRLWVVLFPNKDPARTNDQTRRDLMHIDTAMRYGCAAFVTRDAELLARAADVAAAFDHFGLWNPEHALEVVERQRRRRELRSR